MKSLQLFIIGCLLFEVVNSASAHDSRNSTESWMMLAKSSGSSASVRGYTKKNGTYVKPYKRSIPNKTKKDNWSTQGNVNPYTGKAGNKPSE